MRIVVLLGCIAVALSTVGDGGARRSEHVAAPLTGHLVGQKLVVRMAGTVPSAALLARARRGQIGGVILYRPNITSAAQLRSLTARLQRAAAGGGQPRLLIAVDQEGGSVTTLPWLPPTLSPPQMGRLESTGTARREGRRTGAGLRDLGIDVDLAPVADVPASTASFMYLQGRTWSFDAGTTARLAGAFASGLRDARTQPAMKHFPGIGFATRNTDEAVVHIGATKTELAPGLEPYRRAVAGRVPLIMLSNAVYDAYDRRNGAGWSPAIATRMLRGTLGFRGVSITDSLDGAAHARRIPTDPLAVEAAAAGTDLILVTGSEPASSSVYTSLLRAASHGSIGHARLLASYRRILALKASISRG